MKQLIFLLILLFIQSCATGYKLIEPEQHAYISETNNQITFGYNYPKIKANYARKARRNGIQLVAVKINNQTDKAMIFGEDLELQIVNGPSIELIDKETTFKKLRQKSETHLIYFAPGILPLPVTDGVYVPMAIYLVPIGVGNMVVAGRANKKFLKELEQYYILNDTINPNEERVGLIGVLLEKPERLNLVQN